jgi:hypothetical protein
MLKFLSSGKVIDLLRQDIDAQVVQARPSDSHSSVCAIVASFEMDGIIPSRHHANAFPATILQLLRLATAQKGHRLLN